MNGKKDEYEIFNSGPVAVLEAISQFGAGLNLSVLAQACARKARWEAEELTAIAWTEAAIAAYAAEYARLPKGIAFHSLESVSFGLRGIMVLKFGLGTAETRRYLREIDRWLKEGARALGNPGSYRNAFDSEVFEVRETALIAQERFQSVAELWRKGLLKQELDAWFLEIIGTSAEPA